MTAFEHGIKPALRRLWNDIRYPLAPDPEDAKNRLGWLDVTHAWSNLWVEIVRTAAKDDTDAWPHWVGRGIAWGIPFVALVHFGVIVL